MGRVDGVEEGGVTRSKCGIPGVIYVSGHDQD